MEIYRDVSFLGLLKLEASLLSLAVASSAAAVEDGTGGGGSAEELATPGTVVVGEPLAFELVATFAHGARVDSIGPLLNEAPAAAEEGANDEAGVDPEEEATEGAQVAGSRDPNLKCWITGNLPSTWSVDNATRTRSAEIVIMRDEIVFIARIMMGNFKGWQEGQSLYTVSKYGNCLLFLPLPRKASLSPYAPV